MDKNKAFDADNVMAQRLDAQLSSGYTLKEVVLKASLWWDRKGRKLITNPEFLNPDIGFNSGITRGLEWDSLEAKERGLVVFAYHNEQILKAENERTNIQV